jgi:hypothetical protein
MIVYYCIPPEDGLRTEISSDSNDKEKEDCCVVSIRVFGPISYRGVLLSALLHAVLHNLLNILVQIANKM